MGIFPAYGSILTNILDGWAPRADKGESTPGCWIYPDMLEVGVTRTPDGWSADLPKLSFAEERSHFGMWCVSSSPLILGLDLRDAAALDAVWPIISNREAIAVNQAWAGDAGQLVVRSNETVIIED